MIVKVMGQSSQATLTHQAYYTQVWKCCDNTHLEIN